MQGMLHWQFRRVGKSEPVSDGLGCWHYSNFCHTRGFVLSMVSTFEFQESSDRIILPELYSELFYDLITKSRSVFLQNA